MPWGKSFETIDPETGKLVEVKCKTDENGHVTDILTDLVQDNYRDKGGKHGHIWELNKDADDIGSHDPKVANDDSGK
jgi:hypothetical protein